MPLVCSDRTKKGIVGNLEKRKGKELEVERTKAKEKMGWEGGWAWEMDKEACGIVYNGLTTNQEVDHTVLYLICDVIFFSF